MSKKIPPLSETHPELAKQWHPTRNGTLTPNDVVNGSSKKVWWYLPYDDPTTGKHFDFEWQSNVYNRARLGHGCPYLSTPVQAVWEGFNDLETTHPEIAAQWHPTKNGTLKPKNVMAGSPQKVWWLLPYDDIKTGKHFNFEWECSIQGMAVRGFGCPYLSGQKVHPEFNSLAALYPELVKEWHPTKNGALTPFDVAAKSNKKVWWLLPYDDIETGKHFDFEWETTINARCNGHQCPYLSNQKIHPEFNSLAAKNPELAKEWHPTKNGNLKPTEISNCSGKKVWWLIIVNNVKYEWQACVSHRASGSTHPALAQSRLCKMISEALEKAQVIFTQEKIFANCSAAPKGRLRYDFFLNNEELLIEGDGEQHFKHIDYFHSGEGFSGRIKRDNIKNQYTSTHQIPLLRIPYIYDTARGRPKIEQFVLEFIQTKQVPQEILDYYKQFEFSNYVECVELMQTELAA